MTRTAALALTALKLICGGGNSSGNVPTKMASGVQVAEGTCRGRLDFAENDSSVMGSQKGENDPGYSESGTSESAGLQRFADGRHRLRRKRSTFNVQFLFGSMT